MASNLRSIILPNGIAAGSPFSVGKIPKIAAIVPPLLVDSITTEVLGKWTVGTDPAPAATETIRWQGGFVSDTGVGHDNFIAGRGAAAQPQANARNTVVGTVSKSNGGANSIGNTIVGYGNDLSGVDVGSVTIVGSSNIFNAGFPASTTVVGASNQWNNAFSGPGVGTGSSWQGAGVGVGNQQSISGVNNWVAVGRAVQITEQGQTVVGDNARGQATHLNSIVLGRNALSVAANSFVAGAQNVQISTVLFGAGDAQVGGQSVIHRHTNASGVDDAAGNINFRGGLNTGATLGSAGGRLRFQVGIVAASSAVVQTPQAVFQIQPSFQTTGTPKQSASVVFSKTLDGAGALIGTLNTAPTVGDPTYWVPIVVEIAGVETVVAFPTWAIP